MRVSLEWIHSFVDLSDHEKPIPAAALAHEVTLKIVEVEDVIEIDGDVVFEIDNKSLTNRPDLWGHYGIAREVAAIYDAKLSGMPQQTMGQRPPAAQHLVGELDPAICRRFAAVELAADPGGSDAAGVSMKTPDWMRDRLASIGEQTVHPLVDLSNYVMFTTGQPTHIYDLDTITPPLSVCVASAGGVIGPNAALELVAGQPAQLDPDIPVVRDTNVPVAVAGVMGSAGSGVSASSGRFVLEVAAFRGRVIRAASTRLGLRTEASARFEKELDTQRVDAAIDLFLHLLPEVAPGVRPVAMQDVQLEKTERAQVTVDPAFLSSRIGTDLGGAQVRGTLESLGFDVQTTDSAGSGSVLAVTAPTWRSTGDISQPHDIVEEVARIHGYDNLPSAGITVALTQPAGKPLDRVIREQLAKAGLYEVITYPWAVDDLASAAGGDPGSAVRTNDAPAPDQATLRTSLLPGLLQAAATNLPNRSSIGIFEAGAVFAPAAPDAPAQSTMVAGLLVGDDGGSMFRRAKGILDLVGREAHLIEPGFATSENPPVWSDRAVSLTLTCQGQSAGVLGLLAPRTKRAAGLSAVQVACFELDLAALAAHPSRSNRYEQVPELPEADFDLSVVAADTVPWSRLAEVAGGAHQRVHHVAYVDEFRGAWVPSGHRSVTMRVALRAFDTTLSAEEIGQTHTVVLDALDAQLGARTREARA